MAASWDSALERQVSPVEPSAVRAAGQPAILPGVPRLALEPVQHLGQAPPSGLVTSAPRAGVSELAEQPSDQRLPALTGLPPVLLGWPRHIGCGVPFRRDGAGLRDYWIGRNDGHRTPPS